MPMMVTCKVCKRRAEFDEFAEGCPNEECIMSRRGRANKNQKPPAILTQVTHHKSCTCKRCLDIDTQRLERELDKSWEAHNRAMKGEAAMANITVSIKEMDIIGPYDGMDESKAEYVTCPPAISMLITPRSRRRK